MIKIAKVPCSWGVLEFDLEGKKLDYDKYMAELTEPGCTGTELCDLDFLPFQVAVSYI